MLSEGKLTGKRENFPLTITRESFSKARGRSSKKIYVENLDKLIDLFTKIEQSPDSTFQSKGKTIKKKTWQIIQEMGISPRQMTDNRTENILEEYLFYQKAPHQAPYNSVIWKKSVIILNNVLNTSIF